MKTIRILIAALLALLVPAAVQATTVDWSLLLEGRAGYGTNPYLNYYRGNAGSGLVGVTAAPTISLRDATSTTELAGSYYRDQYFSHYDHADNYDVELRRKQQFSATVSGNARAGYFSSVSGLFSPFYGPYGGLTLPNPGEVDRLAVGARERRVYGDAGLDWTPNARDAFSIQGVAQHETYSRFGGDYTYVGGTGSYSRAIDARTRVGVQLTGGVSTSRFFPRSTSIQPAATLQRTLSAHWTFNGSIGAIIERQRDGFGGRLHNSVTPGFTASFCGTYPRTTLCLTAARTSAPSTIGGLRRDTQVGANITYNLSPRSRILGTGLYGSSSTPGDVQIAGINYGTQRYALVRAEYQHDLSRRISAGVGGSYQARSGRGLPEVHALAITFNLTAKLGRIS